MTLVDAEARAVRWERRVQAVAVRPSGNCGGRCDASAVANGVQSREESLRWLRGLRVQLMERLQR